MVVSEACVQSMRLIHRGQESPGLFHVLGFFYEARHNRIPQIDAAQRIVEVTRQTQPFDERRFKLDFHAVRFAFVEIRVRIDSRVGKQNRMDRLIAFTVIAAHTHAEAARHWLRHAQLDLVFDNGLERGQRLFKIGEKPRQTRTRDQDILYRWWNKKMIVGRMYYGARPGDSIGEIQTRTPVSPRRGKAVAINPKADVCRQLAAQLNRVLQICTALSSGLPPGKCDGTAFRTLYFDVAQSLEIGKS